MRALVVKGASPGTVLAFMMLELGLSPPELVILRRVLKRQLIAIFAGAVPLAIIIIDYLYNLIV